MAEIKMYNNKVWGYTPSSYALENGYLDYRTLAKMLENTILNNDIIKYEVDYWEVVNGSEVSYYDNEKNEFVDYDEIEEWDNIDECYSEIYQYYMIDYQGYKTLERFTNEIVFYNEKLDIYLWGITHWGTSWDYVLTDIKLLKEE